MKTRRISDREFKEMVVELSHNRQDFTALVAGLDIKPDLIYRWLQEATKYPDASFQG